MRTLTVAPPLLLLVGVVTPPGWQVTRLVEGGVLRREKRKVLWGCACKGARAWEKGGT